MYTHIHKTHSHRQLCGDIQMERGTDGGEQWWRGRGDGEEKNFCLGDGQTMQSADDILLTCTLETYMCL